MGSNWLVIISYFLLSMIAISLEIYRVIKKKRITFIFFSNLFYVLIYFITPAFFLIQYNSGSFENRYLSYYDSTCDPAIVLLVSFFVYSLINIVYVVFNKREKKVIYEPTLDNSIEKKNNSIIFLILLVVGWVSLLLWTDAFGGVFGFMKHASAVRSGLFDDYNKLAFLKWMCPSLLLCSLYYFQTILSKLTVRNLIMFLIATLGSILYLLANDGRNLVVSFVFAFVILAVTFKGVTVKSLSGMLVIIAACIMMFGNLGSIMSGLRSGNDIEFDYAVNAENLATDEYGQVFTNVSNVLARETRGENGYSFKMAIKNLLYTFVPKRFREDGVLSLHEYNDSFYGDLPGSIPSDLITSSIYMFGLAGIIIYPVFFGFIIAKLDGFFGRKQRGDVFYLIIESLLLTMLPLRIIGYNDISSILFYFIFIYFALIVRFGVKFFIKDMKKNVSSEEIGVTTENAK